MQLSEACHKVEAEPSLRRGLPHTALALSGTALEDFEKRKEHVVCVFEIKLETKVSFWSS